MILTNLKNKKMTNYSMTTKWETIYKMEGVKVKASDPTDLVTQLRQFAFDQPTTNKQHRERSYVWFKNVDGIDIDVKTDRTFVNDLITYGYVKVLQTTQKTLKTTKNGK